MRHGIGSHTTSPVGSHVVYGAFGGILGLLEFGAYSGRDSLGLALLSSQVLWVFLEKALVVRFYTTIVFNLLVKLWVALLSATLLNWPFVEWETLDLNYMIKLWNCALMLYLLYFHIWIWFHLWCWIVVLNVLCGMICIYTIAWN